MMNRQEIKREIQRNGHNFFERMYRGNLELSNIAGEFMALNVSYVLTHQGYEETYKTLEILKAGLSINQKKFLIRLEKQLKGINSKTEKR